MVQIRITQTLNGGETKEVNDAVANALVNAGMAERLPQDTQNQPQAASRPSQPASEAQNASQPSTGISRPAGTRPANR